MKQRIKIEQLNELSDEQKERLREWWNPSSGDAYYYVKINSTGNVPWSNKTWENDDMKKRTLPLLSIGQMIEFLDDQRQSAVPVPITQIIPNINLIYTDHLCNALWGMVKQAL